MESFAELGELVRGGERDWGQYGDVRAVYWEGRILFNYGFKAEIVNRWNWFEQVSRGLILDEKTGNLVALPMSKFWNYLQGGRVPSGHMVEVTEKLDGSMGILFSHEGKWRISTRGSFESDQALWATEFFNERWGRRNVWIPDSLTLIFEIIYPSNRIVVNYGDREDLVLIAVRDKEYEKDWFFYPDVYQYAQGLGFNTPKTLKFNTVHDIIDATAQIDANQEGWVARFSDGERFKFKGDDYVYMHRIVSQTTFKRVLDAVAGGHIDDMMYGIPKYLLEQVKIWKLEIDRTVQIVEDRVEQNFAVAPKDDRKTYALWVKETCPIDAPYMFSRIDGREYKGAIYKREFGGR